LSIIANVRHSFNQRKEVANAKLAIETLNVINTQVKTFCDKLIMRLREKTNSRR
jgi:hypothetical protein